jgi:hypothetical protein
MLNPPNMSRGGDLRFGARARSWASVMVVTVCSNPAGRPPLSGKVETGDRTNMFSVVHSTWRQPCRSAVVRSPLRRSLFTSMGPGPLLIALGAAALLKLAYFEPNASLNTAVHRTAHPARHRRAGGEDARRSEQAARHTEKCRSRPATVARRARVRARGWSPDLQFVRYFDAKKPREPLELRLRLSG